MKATQGELRRESGAGIIRLAAMLALLASVFVVAVPPGTVAQAGPRLTLNPSGGLVSTRVTVSAAGFGTNTTPASTAIVSVTFGGSALAHETTNDEANLTPGEYILQGAAPGSLVYGDTTAFTIVFKVPPNSRAGAQALSVTNNATAPANNGAANFAVTGRKLTLTPTSGSVGTFVQAAMSGFSAGQQGILSAPGLIPIIEIAIDTAGKASASFTVPSVFGPGVKENTLTFTDDFGNVATAIFTLLAAPLTLDPTEGPPGTTVSFTGTGFDGFIIITVQFTPPEGTAFQVSTTPEVILSDELGNVTGSITVPPGRPGTATISVSDGAVTKSVEFTVQKGAETVQAALQTISDVLVIVWAYDAATQTYTKYDPAAPAVSDLTRLEKGKGYWIQVSQSVTLVFGPGVYNLKAGWNLIGWLGS